MMNVRAARADEIEACREIQRRSGEVFLDTVHAHVADHEPDEPAILRAALAEGLLWVAAEADNAPVGQLMATARASGLVIAQLDVLPEHHRRGIGHMLIEAAEAEARRRGLSQIWLRTFRDIPWNAPYYERLGFQALDTQDPDALDPATAAHERGIGLDPAGRVTMRKRLVTR
ncbi:GNAT family N-acetyltransferase [Pacificimonas sp. WHA3]|uniref:GNAT family N-acetyltransferase n=1 Tax=Pacificimonas pallii TaxID=2827236 RepID=A0ABS6SGI2_9SPHN|nr:GNAT family N-acetyltransferase [Pacificimonas pallii]MBV7257148.1 GNAT family N-acetyltransferase [Pacificimonas pallii]